MLSRLTQNVVSLTDYWWPTYKYLPTVEEFRNVHEIPDKPEPLHDDSTSDEIRAFNTASDKYRKQIAFATWYADQWIPAVCGIEHYNLERQYFHMCQYGEIRGERKVYVPITGEAWGALLWANCREKWIESCKFKDANPKTKLPVYSTKKPETAKFQAKWSDAKSGQVVSGGWKPEAHDAFNAFIEHYKDVRANDMAEDYKRYKYLLELVREKHELQDDEKEPPKKKHKLPKTKPRAAKITFIEE